MIHYQGFLIKILLDSLNNDVQLNFKGVREVYRSGLLSEYFL